MKLVRRRLQILKGLAPDQLIADIMRLAVQGGDTFRLASSPRYTETPLANAFGFEAVWSFRYELASFLGSDTFGQAARWSGNIKCQRRSSFSVVSTLLVTKTGVDDSARIDVGIAARLGTRPSFPIRKDFRAICDIEAVKLDGKAVALLLATGGGWQMLQDDYPELVQMALYASRLTACLDQLQRRGVQFLSLKDLGILATIFQQSLYDLNPAPGTGDLACDPIFNIARLALQIYSDLGLFPAAETYHAKGCLCRELLATLREYFEAGAPRFNELETLSLWTLVMGAIIFYTSYDRDWYLRKMIGFSKQLDHDWQMFKASMEVFLWWDYLFEGRLRDIWEEAWKLTGKGHSVALTDGNVSQTGD